MLALARSVRFADAGSQTSRGASTEELNHCMGACVDDGERHTDSGATAASSDAAYDLVAT